MPSDWLPNKWSPQGARRPSLILSDSVIISDWPSTGGEFLDLKKVKVREIGRQQEGSFFLVKQVKGREIGHKEKRSLLKLKMPPLSPILLLATSSARGEICGGPVSLLPMLVSHHLLKVLSSCPGLYILVLIRCRIFFIFIGQVPDPSDCTAFFTCLAATTEEGGRRSAGKNNHFDLFEG